ncbi:MAG: segregation and condensation protein A [Dermatophilaceae bacterium]
MTTTPPETAGGEAPTAQRDAVVPGGILTRRVPARVFEVDLDVFSGPFDLLLGLIGKHQLDITEIALATVTDEFIAHLRAARETEAGWDLSQASEFLVVAATLLDLKAARLLPQTGPEDEDDLALIEARDLLFARLLQYRAFKDIAHTFGHRMATAGRSHPRAVALEPHLAALLPELVMTITPDQLALLAAQALAPKVPPTVGLSHLHAPAVSVREQAGVIAVRLRRDRVASFRALVADADSTLVVVARFLALLELFRDASVAFEQAEALGELTVRWTGAEDGDVGVGVGDEFDEPASTDEPASSDEPAPTDEKPSSGQSPPTHTEEPS